MTSFRILDTHRLVLMNFQGFIDPELVISFIDKLVKDPAYSNSYNSIIDLQKAEMHYTMESLRKTMDYMATNIDFVGKRKTAYITSLSQQVVPPMLMSTAENKFPMEVKVFSALESAVDWIGIRDISVYQINRILNEMRKS